MVEVNIKTKQAQRFLSSFGSNVDDLKVTIKDGVMEASIAFQTHFFKKKRAIEDSSSTSHHEEQSQQEQRYDTSYAT